MFEFKEKDGSITRVPRVSIMQVSTKHFTCLSHQSQERQQKTETFTTTTNEVVPVNEKRTEEHQSETASTLASMKLGLTQALKSGELLKHKPAESQEMQGPPSSSLSSSFHWNRLDPSETIVLN